MITFTIPGLVVAKQSVRRNGRTGTFYQDPKVERYERMAAQCAKAAIAGMSGFPLTEPCEITFWIYLAVPESWSAAKTDRALRDLIRPTVKPDFDNGIKGPLDGIRKILVKDDCYVTDAHVHKRYAISPHVVVQFEALGLVGSQ